MASIAQACSASSPVFTRPNWDSYRTKFRPRAFGFTALNGLTPASSEVSRRRRDGHDVSRDRPENTPGFDVFGHNRTRRFDHENTGSHFHSGAAHVYRGSPHRPASDQRPTD